MASADEIRMDVNTMNETSPVESLMMMTTKEIVKHLESKQMGLEDLTNCVYNISNGIDENRQNDHDDFEDKIDKKRNCEMYINKFEAIVDGLLNGKKNNVWSAEDLVNLLTKTYVPKEDKSRYTFLSLAFKCQSKEVIRKCMKLLWFKLTPKDSAGSTKQEEHTKKTVEYGVVVSGITPMTSTQETTSCLELLLPGTDTGNKILNHTITEILDIPPIQKIERIYNNMTTFVYIGIILLHAAYMSLFSYSSMFLMDKLRNGDSVNGATDATMIFYFVLPMEPVVIIPFYIRWFWRNYSKFKLCGNKRYTFKHIIWKFSPAILQLAFTCLVIATIVQFVMLQKVHLHNTLSVTLLLGWMTTLSYTQGVRPLRVFWKIIMHMIAIDVYKILFVYAFVLLSFSFALHIQFQLSQALIDEYPTPFHTMFLVYGLMLGVGQLFSEEYKTNIREGGGTTVLSRILFVLYSVIATLVLLNLLIAMMNTSYNEEISDLRISRRIDSFERALSVEETIGVLPKCFKEPLTRRVFQNIIKTGSLDRSTGEIISSQTRTRNGTGTETETETEPETATATETGTGTGTETGSVTKTNSLEEGRERNAVVWYVQVKGRTKEVQTPDGVTSGTQMNDNNLQLILELQNSVDDIQDKLTQLQQRIKNCTCVSATINHV